MDSVWSSEEMSLKDSDLQGRIREVWMKRLSKGKNGSGGRRGHF